MVFLSCCCSSSSSKELQRHLVLPGPPADEDDTRAASRLVLFSLLGVEVFHLELQEQLDKNSGEKASAAKQQQQQQQQQQQEQEKQEQQRRLLRVCSCLCEGCVRVSCGAWLDSLRIVSASDSELFFFGAQLQAAAADAADTTNCGERRSITRNKRREASGGAAAVCLREAEGREVGTREEAWGLLAGCSTPFTLRHCLLTMQQPPQVLLLPPTSNSSTSGNSNGSRRGGAGVEGDSVAAAALVAQARRLLSLFCDPANALKPAVPEPRETALLRAAAAELGVYVHPNLEVARFAAEGRGLRATQHLQRGDLLLRLPTVALVNVHSALLHPTFSSVAQMLLGLPPEHLAKLNPHQQEHHQQEQQGQDEGLGGELQPLVDTDVVVCLFLLFLAFACGKQGARALLRCLPPAGTADAAATAEALCAAAAAGGATSATEGAAAVAAAAAAARATVDSEVLLLSESEEVVQFLGDDSLLEAVKAGRTKCELLQQQLLPLLHEAFPSPPRMPRHTGVLSACRAAAAAAAAAAAREGLNPASQMCGCGAVAAAAELTAAVGGSQGSAEGPPGGPPASEGFDLLCAFVGHLNLEDLRWALGVLESRSFSLKAPLSPLLPEAPLNIRAAQELGTEEKEREKKRGEHEGEEGEEAEKWLGVPFALELRDLSKGGACKEDAWALSLPLSLSCAPRAPPAQGGEGAPPSSPFYVRLPRRGASLVPLAELLNHHLHAQVGPPLFEEEGRWLCFRAVSDVPQGAQVYLQYGPLQSWQFVAHFGFSPETHFLLMPPSARVKAPHANACTHNTELQPEGPEWRFAAETLGNPEDFVALEVKVSEDDAECCLKTEFLQLHGFPSWGIFSVGSEVFSWKLLASLFVAAVPSLDSFLGGKQGYKEVSQAALAAAAAAGETPWGPAFTHAALRGDSPTAAAVRDTLQETLHAVAGDAEARLQQLAAWEALGEAAPPWTKRWAARFRGFLKNRISLAQRMQEALDRAPLRGPH